MFKDVKKQIQNFLLSFMAGCLAVVFTMSFLGVDGMSSSASSSDLDQLMSASNSYDQVQLVQNVSVVNSRVFPSDYVASTGEAAEIDVLLYDEFGSPVSGHKLNLVSSDPAVSIYAANDTTTETGEASFQVLSAKKGKVSFSVYDQVSGKTLNAKSNVVFYDSYDDIFGSSFGSASVLGAIGSSSGAASTLKFEDVKSTISVGDYVSFTVSAYDDLDQVVTDYDGTVRFSVVSGESSYVNLPNDYQFEATDLGQHTFSLALNFQKAGNYFVEARDVNNTEVYGAFGFVVGAGSTVSNAGGITIESPVSGTYSNAVQVITGKAPIGSSVKIFDNEIEMASVLADINGAYSYTTKSLPDGVHAIYAALVNDIGTIVAVSPTVNLQIDTQAPELGEIAIEPSSTVSMSEPVTVKYFNNEPLTDAAVVVNDNLYQMLDSGEGFYEASFIAPDVAGEYILSFIVVDQLGNENRYDNASTLTVGNTVSSAFLSDVQNLVATASANRVTLNWSAVDNAKNYRVYYGISPNELINAVDTFTNSTTWYVPNLKNGTEYYFSIVAVNENGDTSQHFSNIVSAIPGGVVQVDLSTELGLGGAEMIDEMEGDVSETGPGVWVLVLLSLVAGYFYTKSSKVVKA